MLRHQISPDKPFAIVLFHLVRQGPNGIISDTALRHRVSRRSKYVRNLRKTVGEQDLRAILENQNRETQLSKHLEKRKRMARSPDRSLMTINRFHHHARWWYRIVQQSATWKGIGNLTAIFPIRFKFSLKNNEGADSDEKMFKFFRTRAALRSVLHHSVRNLSLRNIIFLVSDDKYSCVYLLIGLRVLQHLRVDNITTIKHQLPEFDDSDCSDIYISFGKHC